ncbi:recombinase family protein [Streptomyces scabiei]|uniref:recombinase family protein n=1 Tax=Streptomyces scabiei TaxID=1930 RepID=UPI00277D1362|nr:recombinase family protein [Streptomyces scabiei]
MRTPRTLFRRIFRRKFFFTVMVAFAELERDMIVEPTRAGLDAAKAQGRTGGRPTAITEDEPTVAKAGTAEGESVSVIAEALGVSRATLYRPIGRPRTLPPPL